MLSLAQYVYNNIVHTFIQPSLFKIIFDYQTKFQFDWNKRKCFNVFVVRDRIQLLWNECDRLIKRLRSVQQAQVKTHNSKINFKHSKIKNKMMLFTKNLKNVKSKKKLFHKFTKLFEIKKVVELQAYRFCLFDQWRIHFGFYVSLLKSYYINVNIVFFTEMILMSENEKYKVKDILKNKNNWRKYYYFVCWKKFLFCKDSWIFKHYLTNA